MKENSICQHEEKQITMCFYLSVLDKAQSTIETLLFTPIHRANQILFLIISNFQKLIYVFYKC
jgi:hypothetical protein